MKKPRHQPALASLSLAEREQLADWLRHEHYQAVLARVNKLRPEGFGLRISEKPLRTFWMKVGMLDAINAKLSPDKKIPLAIFEKLASRDYYLLTSSENKTVAEAHAQIIRTTADLAASGDNSPHQLLALQRLADFPARAEIRENREQLNREKWAHKLDMDNFRKHIATERLELAKKSFALREKITTARCSEAAAEERWSEAAAEEHQPGNTPSKLPFPRTPGPCPLPDEIVIRNRAYALKLLAGQVDPDTGEELPDPAPSSLPPFPPVQNPAPALPTIPDSQFAIPNSQSAQPNNQSSIVHHQSAQPSPFPPVQNSLPKGEGEGVTPRSIHGIPADPKPSSQSIPPLPPFPPVQNSLSDRVHHYTIARIREHTRWNNDRFGKPFPYASPPFITQNRHCPCGQNAPTPEGGVATTPCPLHESGEFTPFPDSFWSLSPFSNAYIDHLTTRGLPYREPQLTDYK